MKKAVLLFVMVCFVFTSASVYAADARPFGGAALQAKVHHFEFTDDWAGVDLDKGWYVGLEAMFAITERFYVCPEVGYVKTDNSGNVNIDGEQIRVNLDEAKLIPVEINVKYAIPFAERFVWTIGAGASYSYFKVKADAKNDGLTAEENTWVLGGQFLTELKARFGERWFAGLNFKYQITDNLDANNKSVKATNWRLGPSIGFIF